MPRLAPAVVLALVAAPAAARAQEPEKLLSPTSQLFVRWDGVTAHKAAYDGSALGAALRGPSGDSLRALLARLPKMLGNQLLASPLLDGKSPDELKAVHADLKAAEQALDLLLDKGVLVGAEVTGPRPTLGGVGKAIGGLLGGKAPDPENFLPDARLLVVVPDAADRSHVVFGSLRLLITHMTNGGKPVEPLPPAVGRTGFRVADPDKGNPVRVAWWVEGKHVVFYAGTSEPETVAKDLVANAKAGGVTGHPLFQRCLKTGEFESVTRGYVDTGAVVGLARRLAGPFVPGLGEKLDALGLGNLKAVVFSSGFQGKESRALYEIDLPGERKGFARLLKQNRVTLADLPPLPPDVSRFSLLRVDYPGVYDAVLTGAEMLAPDFSGTGGKETPQARRRDLERLITKTLGVNLAEDLIPHLGDRFCTFQSPTEGLSVFGTVVCVSVKDAAKVRVAADQLTRGLENIAGGRTKVRKRVVAGVDTREIYNREFGVVTPTYAVVGDWLVIGGTPQCVQGLALRHAGKLAKWSPDPETAARLAQMPSDSVGIQYCHPKSVAHNLCCIGPLFLSQIGSFSRRNSPEFDPVEVGLVPNGHELASHLFPNLTYTRDDGRTVRIDVRDSFSLPLEFIGLEPIMFAFAIGLG